MTDVALQTAPEIPDKLYFKIGEVSELLGVEPYVLRYWETEFPMLEPVKGPNGHRLYRQEDVDLVMRIKRLLYDEGFTIAGARRHLRELAGGSETETNGAASPSVPETPPAQLLNRKMLLDLRDSLRAFLTLLERK